VKSLSACEFTCPSTTPYKCWNGICATGAAGCPCNVTAPLRCPTDSKCYAAWEDCPCSNKTLTRYCPDTPTVCIESAGLCLTLGKCTDAQVQCSDGTCAASLVNCPCDKSSTAPPGLSILANDGGFFDITAALRLAVAVRYAVCGQDRSTNVAVVWSISTAGSSALFSGSSSDVSLKGTSLSLPPNYFSSESVAYVFTVVATVDSHTTSTSVQLTSFAPPPSLAFVGGASRKISSAVSIRLSVTVTDPWTSRKAAVSWKCCTGEGCTLGCPSDLSSILDKTSNYTVVLPSGIPANAYKITFYYGGQTTSQTVNILDALVPTVSILTPPPPLFVINRIVLYVIVTSSPPFNLTWTVNGSSISSVSGASATPKTLVFDAGSLAPYEAHTVTATATNADGTGDATTVVFPQNVPTLTCSLTSNDDSTSTVTALYTPLRISASTGSSEITSDMSFRFGYFDFVTGQRILLSSASQTLTYFDFTAPFHSASESSAEMIFFASLRIGALNNASQALCNISVTRADVDTSAVVAAQAEALEQAKQSGDISGILRSASTLTSVLAADANETSRKAAQELILNNVLEAVSNPSATLSSEQRSAAVQTVVALSTNRDGTIEASEQASLLNILNSALKPSTGTDSAFDAASDGPGVLKVLNSMKAASGVASVAENLAESLVSSTKAGETTKISAGNISISAYSVPASDINGQSLSSETASITLPTTFDKFDPDSSITIASVEFSGKNPRGSAGTEENEDTKKGKISDSGADYKIFVNGKRLMLSGLETPIILELIVASNHQFLEPICKFFNETTEKWSTKGVTTVGYNSATRTLSCATTHLTTFAYSVNEPKPSTAEPTTAEPSSAEPPKCGRGCAFSIALVLSIVALVALCAAFVCWLKKREDKKGTGVKNDDGY